MPLYVADLHTRSQTYCNKFYERHGVKTPGVFFVYCTCHGALVGYHMLKFAESERTVFEFIMTRFRKAPPLIVYDNVRPRILVISCLAPSHTGAHGVVHTLSCAHNN